MKDVYGQHVAQIGSKAQHELVISLAKKRGYKSLRFALADYYNVNVLQTYKAQKRSISVREAASIIASLRNGQRPSDYVIRLGNRGST